MSAQVASWYGEAWKYRWPISVNVSTAGATSDVEILIPPDWDLFWDNVDSTGDDIRVTTADGKTLVTTMDLASWTYASRTGVIEIDGLDTETGNTRGASMQLLWVYWGNSVATTVVSAFAPAAAITGYICLERPAVGRTFSCMEELVTATRPSQKLHSFVGSLAEQDYYLDMSGVLAGRSRPYNGWLGLESVAGFYFVAWNDTSKATVANIVHESLCRFVYDSSGRLYAKVRVDIAGAGLSSGTKYILVLWLLSSLDTGKQTGYGVHIYAHDLVN